MRWISLRWMSSCTECGFAFVVPNGWSVPISAAVTLPLLGESPPHFDLGSSRFRIDAVQSINSVLLPGHHQSELPTLRTQPAELYLSRLSVPPILSGTIAAWYSAFGLRRLVTAFFLAAESRVAPVSESGCVVPSASRICARTNQRGLIPSASPLSVPIPRHHHKDLPTLRTQPAELYLSPFLAPV
jgi:hypothetical protein